MIPTFAIAAGGLSLAVSFGIGAVLTLVVRKWALRHNFVDRPGVLASHKEHLKVTPLGGGMAMTVAILFPMVAVLLIATLLQRADAEQLTFLNNWAPGWSDWVGGMVQKTPQALAIVAGGLVMHLLGVVDDVRSLSPMFKLVVQIAVALMLSAGFDVRAAELLGPVPSVIITTLWIVALTNALNFMDNVDGLAAGVAAITAVVLAIAGFVAGQVFVPCLLLLVAGAALGFVIFNFPQASIFMGDGGSLVIGYMLAVCTILTTFVYNHGQQSPFGLFAPLVVFAIPLYDMVSVLVRRQRAGVPPWRGDRGHFSHRLMRTGLSSTAAVLTIYLATLATALPAILLPVLNWAGAIVVFAQCLCVVIIIAILELRDEP